MNRTYALPPADLPSQSTVLDERAVFTEAYAFLPADTMRDIVTSFLPGWAKCRSWIIARPLSGFAETFSHFIMEMAEGGTGDGEPDARVEGVLFMVGGAARLTIDGTAHNLRPGSYAFLPAGADWSIAQSGDAPATFHWVRKRYEPAPGIAAPKSFVTHDDDVGPISMPNTADKWATTRFVEPDDLSHDMHVNIVTFQPGGKIPFMETHVMEHGLYVLQGTANYRLNQDWVECGPGDYMWLRAFCPQACVATGDEPFRYLLYKDVNRFPRLGAFSQ
jgi:(S)-ureidoglycine aminohydrolase